MEMPVCGEAEAAKLGQCLASFFVKLEGGAAPAEEEKVAEPAPESPAGGKEWKKPAPRREAPQAAKAPPPRVAAPPARVTSPPSYSGSNRSSSGGSYGSPSYGSAVHGDARSGASRRQDEMKNMFGSGSSVKDRMKAFNNSNTVNFDPVHFAVNQNKAKLGECLFSIGEGVGRFGIIDC